MSDHTRSIETDSGTIQVRDLAPETLDQLRTLFPMVGWIEDQGRRLLALLPIQGPRVLQGIRTGYGWYPPEQRESAKKSFAIERLRIIEASASFRSRTFRGVLMPAACLMGKGDDQHSQVGELLFLRTREPLERGLGNDDPVREYENAFGVGATDVILSFVAEICSAWRAAGSGKVTFTDCEPCPADWGAAEWRADIVLVDDRIVVIRPELVAEDPLLSALARAGVTEIEHTPTVILIQPPNESAAQKDGQVQST